jgi:hypothetical protein
MSKEFQHPAIQTKIEQNFAGFFMKYKCASRRLDSFLHEAAQNFEVFSRFKSEIIKSKNLERLMSFTRPIQWYHSHVDPIWPDGTFKKHEKD